MKTLNEPVVFNFSSLNKRKIQRQCFQKPQKLNINATYIHVAVCFNITGVPPACIYFASKNISFGFHSIVNLCKHGKLPNLSNLNVKET